MGLKGKYPFRLGATSYIVPADFLTNVQYLSNKVDDIELVLFESNEMSELPDWKTIDMLKHIANKNNLTYTIHLPLDLWLGDSNQAERQRSVKKCLRVIEQMRLVHPFGYILHCNRICRYDNRKEAVSSWKDNIEKSIDEFLFSGPSSDLLCVETLDYPFEFIEQIITDKGLSICLDIGHLLLNNYSVEEYLNHYFRKSRIIHLHGVNHNRDHCDISTIDKNLLSMLFSMLSAHEEFERVLTLEVFNETELDASLSFIEKFAR
jgi:sugar phosphate isomerase/epimerase